MKKVVIFLSIIVIIAVAYFVVERSNDKENEVNLNSELKLESEKNGVKKYNFSVASMEDEPITIEFKVKNDISIALKKIEGGEENVSSESLIYDIPERNVGDKMILNSGETLEYSIMVDTEKLTSGKYELIVNFSAENVEVIKETTDIVVE